MKKYSIRIGFFIVLSIFFSFLAVADAAGVQDTYYYPGYNASKSGYVDLMNYMKDVTVSLNGEDYSAAETEELKSSGKQLEMNVGDSITFNFHFSFCGRAYSGTDITLLDKSKSTYVTYANATKFLNGKSAEAGEKAILDDSSLMKYTTADATVLRMDIAWLLALCPEDYKCSFKGNKIAFRQGTGTDSHYLYFYFPDGIGNDVYANDGYFSIDARIGKDVDRIEIPGKPGYYVSGKPWSFQIKATKYAEFGNTGRISSYGDVTVKKVWATSGAHPDAKIILSYKINGKAQTAFRTIAGNGSAEFTIREGMTDCVLSEDMTGLPNYRSDMTTDSTGRVFTFTNTLAGEFYFAKTDANGSMLPGAELSLYQIAAGGTRTLLESWTSGSSARKVMLPPGNYLLRESRAPVGYASAVDVSFEVTDAFALKGSNGDTVTFQGKTLTLIDRELYVSITKTDNDGNPLSGATIQIKDLTTNEVVDVWVSDGTMHTVTRVGSSGIVFNSMHKYRLEEVSAPNGYKLADLIDFQFNADGTINGHPHRLFNIENDRKNGGGEEGGGGGGGDTPHDVPKIEDTPTGPSGEETYFEDEDSILLGNKEQDSSIERVQTGDSIVMWVELGLSVLCFAGAMVILAVLMLRFRSDKRREADR